MLQLQTYKVTSLVQGNHKSGGWNQAMTSTSIYIKHVGRERTQTPKLKQKIQKFQVFKLVKLVFFTSLHCKFKFGTVRVHYEYFFLQCS